MMIVLIVAAMAALACAAAATVVEVKAVPVIVENPADSDAQSTPVAAGVPFARGALRDVTALSLADSAGDAQPVQAEVLSRWPDGSVRWALVDFLADVPASSSARYSLSAGGPRPALTQSPVEVRKYPHGVHLSNGIVRFNLALGGSYGTLSSADGKACAAVNSTVEIGVGDKRITSKVVIDVVDAHSCGPVRGEVVIRGRRVYSDGTEGPLFATVQMFAGSPFIRVEDTFVYAHNPGTHAEPRNPLSLWQVQARTVSDPSRLRMASLVPPEESEGLVVKPDAIAFWGVDKPFDFSRHTDEELVGEDTPGMALGVGKSCAALVGIAPASGNDGPGALGRLWAHTTGEVYAASGVLGNFAPAAKGRFDDVEEGMRQILGFWMWYQDNDPEGSFHKGPWHGLFDWGDWQTRFANREHQPTGWNYYEGRYGWDCNEMDTTLMLWSAFFHTGRPEYWRAAVAMSRHMMDVDVLNVDYRAYHDQLPEHIYDPHSYGAPWKEGRDRLYDINTVGLGRRHNVQHWGNGVGDTRHTWNGGVMMYYYMTGNRRAYDTAVNMAEMHMQRIWGYAAGEYTLSLWCIYNAWQLTGDKRYLNEFKYRLGIVHKLRLPDGSLPEHLDFDKAKAYPEVDGNHGAYLDLTLDYVSNALIDYHNDTGDAVAREVLLGLAERNLKDTPEGPADYQRIDALRILAWAYNETGDKRFLDRTKYHLSSLAAKPLAKWPSSPKEWEQTWGLIGPHDWDIRVVGPAIRMAPYAIKAIGDPE